MKVKHFGKKIDNLFIYIIAIGVFFNGYCYLTWENYNPVIIRDLTRYFAQFSKILLIIFAIFHMKKTTSQKMAVLLAISLSVLFVFHYGFLGYKYCNGLSMNDITIVLAIVSLLILPDSYRSQLCSAMLKVFSLMVLPSLIYFILEGVGVIIPSTYLECGNNELKVQFNMYYSHYPFGLIMRQFGHISRYTGIFDEAGFVGTLCAFFIPVASKEKKKIWKILLYIEALFSLSMACYLLILIYWIIKAYQKGAIRLFRLLIIIPICFLLFINIDFHNDRIANIQSRIDFSSSYLVRDNRTTDEFDEAFNEFIEDGGYPLIMGYGGMGAYTKNPQMNGVCSWLCLIYDYGIVGSILLALIFCFIFKSTRYNKSQLLFLIPFVVSIYQRPYIFTYLFIMIYVTALSYLSDGSNFISRNKQATKV